MEKRRVVFLVLFERWGFLVFLGVLVFLGILDFLGVLVFLAQPRSPSHFVASEKGSVTPSEKGSVTL